MFKNYFYHKGLRKIVVVFGTLFNNIQVVRTDASNDEVKRIKVPLSYGPKEKFIARTQQDPALLRPIDIILPRMSFQITTIQYDGTRKLNSILQNVKVETSALLKKQFTGVAYNVGFEVSIMVKNQDDGLQIVEQILPFFTPDFTISYVPISELAFKEDMPIVLNGVAMADNYDADWMTRRDIIWTLNFTAQTFLYGPIKTQGVIKKAQVDILLPPGSGPVTDEEVLKTPRQIRVTTEPDPLTADADDDFGFTETFEQFADGRKYNPVTDTDDDIV